MNSKETEPTFTASKSKKRQLIGLILIVLVLLVAVLTYVYWYQAPNKVVGDALRHVANTQSATYTGTASSSGATKMATSLNGGVAANGATLNANFTFDVSGKKYTLEANGLMDSKGDAYVKVRNINSLVDNYRRAIPENSQKLFDQIIAKIDDKWIRLSAEDIQSYNASAAKLQKCVAGLANKVQTDEAQKAQLIRVYEKHPFVVIDKSLGAKSGNVGYLISTDESIFRAFSTELKSNTELAKSLSDCNTGLASSNGTTTVATKPQLELWIGQWTHKIARLTFKDESSGQTTAITIEPTFDRPVAIATPKSSTTLEQLQKDVQALLTSSQPTAP